VYIQFTKFRIEFRSRLETFKKKSSGAGKKIPAIDGIIRLHPKNSPLRSAAPKDNPLPAGKGSESRSRKDRDSGAYYIAAPGPRFGVACNFAGHEQSRFVQSRVDLDHTGSGPDNILNLDE
jgi:hypothetical protein